MDNWHDGNVWAVGHGLKNREEESATKWIRKDFDADGYFLLQLQPPLTSKDEYPRNKFYYKDKFLTADNASSLTILGTCTVIYVRTVIMW